MGGVNSAPRYVTEVGIGKPDGTVTDTTHQGGIVSIYYLGAIFGCFAGGWLADRVGRINGLLAGSLFALIGGALQAGAQDSNFMLCARVVTGIGTGGKNHSWSCLSLTLTTSYDSNFFFFSSHSFDWHHPGISVGDLFRKPSWWLFGLCLHCQL